MEITKRETLFSTVIICIMLIIGIVISGNINDDIMDKQQEYNTALQIDADKDLFEYGMRTNIGKAFVYGELKAVDTVTYPEVDGEYSYIKKVKERYTRHTRTVTKTKVVNGKTKTYTEVEAYWTWDAIDSWVKHCEKISFLDVEFDYGTIDLPSYSHIDTQKVSSNIRYVYYGTDVSYTGTLYTTLKDDTIHETRFYNNQDIMETIENLKCGWQLTVFWILWILVIAGCVFGFYYIDNRWLED